MLNYKRGKKNGNSRVSQVLCTKTLLATEVLGGVDHVDQSRLDLVPGTGLQTAVGVDPELLGTEVLQHLRETLLELGLAGDTRAVDVVDTRLDGQYPWKFRVILSLTPMWRG